MKNVWRFLVLLLFFVSTLCLRAQIQGTSVKETFLSIVSFNQEEIEKDFLNASLSVLRGQSTDLYLNDKGTCRLAKLNCSQLPSVTSHVNESHSLGLSQRFPSIIFTYPTVLFGIPFLYSVKSINNYKLIPDFLSFTTTRKALGVNYINRGCHSHFYAIISRTELIHLKRFNYSKKHHCYYNRIPTDFISLPRNNSINKLLRHYKEFSNLRI